MRRPLPDLLRERIAADAPGPICVGFSGGPDSTALLHALAQLPEGRAHGLRALHIDHGLHPDSAAWARHCAAFCARIGVPITAIRVAVDQGRGEGVEAAARRARYAALGAQLHAGEWLALAHHRDDQIETVLLKLLRGAGPEGLGGMRALRPFAGGFLWRPLLDVPRADVHAYLVEQRLDSIDDPANHDRAFARNVVRNELLPLLQRHWPHAGTAVLHSAALCRGVADHLAAEAAATAPALARPDATLALDGWLALSPVPASLVLDRWLHGLGLPSPTDAARRELRLQATRSTGGRVPCVCWPGVEAHVYDGRLFALAPLPPVPDDWHTAWDGAPLELPAGCGRLMLADGSDAAATARIDPPLTVRFRQGGERIKPHGDAHTRDVGEMFRRARLPPWLRDRCPLIHASGELVAIADLWTSAHGEGFFARIGARPRWLRGDRHNR